MKKETINKQLIEDVISSFFASIHLYGVISVDELFDTYFKEEDEEAFYNTFVVLSDQNDSDLHFYEFDDGFYISAYETRKQTKECMDKQKGKELFKLPFKEFLKYEESSYYEKNEYTNKLEKIIGKELTSDLMFYISMYNSTVEMAIRLIGDKVSFEVIDLIMNTWNNARMHNNRGFKPNELRK